MSDTAAPSTTVPNNAHCCTCRWWRARPARQDDATNPRTGQCFQAPPNATPEGEAVYPMTLRYSVCGSWEAGA